MFGGILDHGIESNLFYTRCQSCAVGFFLKVCIVIWYEMCKCNHITLKAKVMLCYVLPKLFFSGLDTLPQAGPACLFGNSGCPQRNHPPPPPGGGRPRVGWDFLGKIFVSKIFILPLSSGLPDVASTLAVLCHICDPEIRGSNSGRQGNECARCRRLRQAEILWRNGFFLNF